MTDGAGFFVQQEALHTTFEQQYNTYRLYNDNEIYRYTSTGDESIFARYVTFQPVQSSQ
jgi:hypothetical protein